jgi:hypothetical protein
MMLCDSLSNVGTKQQIPLPLCTESEVAFFVCCLLVVVTLVFRVSEAATLVRAAIAASAFLRKKNKKKKRERAELREKTTTTKGKSGIARKKTKDAIQTLVVLECSSLNRPFSLTPKLCMYVYVRVCVCRYVCTHGSIYVYPRSFGV